MANELNEMVKGILAAEALVPEDIPEIDLYMDQILTLFDSRMAAAKRTPEDKLLTKTMINNYSKAKVIQPVKGKKYSKEQIMQMLIVFDLKNNLAIGEIKELMEPLYENDRSMVAVYEDFLESKASLNGSLGNLLSSLLDEGIDDDREMLLKVMELSYLSNSINKVIQHLIDGKSSDQQD